MVGINKPNTDKLSQENTIEDREETRENIERFHEEAIHYIDGVLDFVENKVEKDE